MCNRLRVVSAIVALAAVAGGLAWVSACRAGEAHAQEFTLPDHEGQAHSLSNLKGDGAVVLFFFTTWCELCSREVPRVRELAELGSEHGVSVVGVSIQEKAETIGKYVEKRKPGFPILIDGDGAVAARFEVEGIPTIVGIDSSGAIAFREHAVPADAMEMAANLTDAS